MAEEQNADPELAELLANPESSLKLQHLETGKNQKLYCDVSTGSLRPYVFRKSYDDLCLNTCITSPTRG
ncbi:hypothetical protein JTE90_007428 [Oedothorax gibbosus]|uniref:Uncharacterized protein n=1 Tax=Oedothorax gibbosus TaxID=931172 RepID=A0AAV6UP42_9ARAC|nr:hypothetical protein JTE90_007428 [Oedothorax gibbosus]